MKKINTQRTLLAAMAVAMLLPQVSCSDEPIFRENLSSSNYMSFRMNIDGADYATDTRAAAMKKYSRYVAKKTDKSDVYLIESVEDRITNNPFAQPTVDDATRAPLVSNSNIASKYAGDGIGLYAFAYPEYEDVSGYDDSYTSAWNYSVSNLDGDEGSNISPFIRDEYLTIGASSEEEGTSFSLTPKVRQYWRTRDQNITFISIFPSADDYHELTADNNELHFYGLTDPDNSMSDPVAIKNPYIKVAVDTTQALHRDYMVGVTSCDGDGKDGQYAVTLQMKHIMAAVAVKLGSGFEAYAIKTVKFYNVKMQSYYYPLEASSKATPDVSGWTDAVYGSEATATRDGESTITAADAASCSLSYPTSGTSVHSMTDMNDYFMMIPQEMASNAKIEVVVYNVSTPTDTLKCTANISTYEEAGESKQENWQMGKTITYTLSKEIDTSESIFIFEPEYTTMYFSYNGSPAGSGETYLPANYTDSIDMGNMRVKSWKIKYSTTSDTPEVSEVSWTAKITDADGNEDATGKSYMASYPEKSENATQITSASSTNEYNRMFIPLMIAAKAKDVESYDTYTLGLHKSKMLGGTANTSYSSSNTSGHIDLSWYRADTINGDGSPMNYKDSSGNGTRHTANCYIIGYPGHYEIPLVMGNAIKSNDVNSDSYSLGTDGSYAMQTLKSFLGKNVNVYKEGGWIEFWSSQYRTDYYYPYSDGGTSNKDTWVLWTDQEGVVTIDNNNCAVKRTPNSDEYYLQFTVNGGDNFKPGNTVIAVRNSQSKIMWSFHIWVTSLKPYSKSDGDMITCDANTRVASTSKAADGTGYKATFLRVPLGFVMEKGKYYPERKTILTLTQTEKNATATEPLSVQVTLIQKEHSCYPYSCCYYQWGRKDPFPGLRIYEEDGHLNVDGTYRLDTEVRTITYRSSPTASATTLAKATVTAATSNIQDGILNPTVFYEGWRFPSDVYYWDLWGTETNKVTDTATNTPPDPTAGSYNRKTIYDPCPVGYRVPSVLQMPAITADGLNHTAESSPITHNLDSEEDLYSKWVNTPYHDHTGFVKYNGYEFYRNKMTSKGIKAPSSSGNTSGVNADTYTSDDVFLMYAFGQMFPRTTETEVGGTFKEVGKHGYYWTATRWTWSSGLTNARGYYFQFGYSDGKSNFEPIFGNTHNNYGFPILAVFDYDGYNGRITLDN